MVLKKFQQIQSIHGYQKQVNGSWHTPYHRNTFEN